MRVTRANRATTKYRSMMGFSQVLLSIIALALLGLGIFDYINPEILNFGNASYIMMILGGMILVVSMMTSLLQDFHLSQGKAWVGALFVFGMLAVGIVVVSMMFGGYVNG